MALQIGSTNLAPHLISLRQLPNPKKCSLQGHSAAHQMDLNPLQGNDFRIGSYKKDIRFGLLTENYTCSLSALPPRMDGAFWRLGSGQALINSSSYANSAIPSSYSIASTGLAFIVDIIIGAVLLIVRLPSMVIAFIKNEKPVIDEVDEKLDEALAVVDDAAKVIEGVAETVEKVSEVIAEDAKATEELTRKVKTTSEKIKSEVDDAVGVLESSVGADEVTLEADANEKHDARPSKSPGEETKSEKLANSKMAASTSSIAALRITSTEVKSGYAEKHSSLSQWGRHKKQRLGSYFSSINLSFQEKELLWRFFRHCFMAMMIIASSQFQILSSLRGDILRLVLATSCSYQF